MIPIESAAVSCVVLCRNLEETSVLMLQRCQDDGGHWNHVCGGVKVGETAVQAIVRELNEETGLIDYELYDGEFIEQFFQPLKNRIMLLPLFVAVVETPQAVLLNEEHTEYRWVSCLEAKKLVSFAHQRTMLEHVWGLFVKNDARKNRKIPFTPHTLHN